MKRRIVGGMTAGGLALGVALGVAGAASHSPAPVQHSQVVKAKEAMYFGGKPGMYFGGKSGARTL